MNITEKHLNVFLALVSMIMVGGMIKYGLVDFDAVLGMFVAQFFNLSVFLCAIFSIEYFLNGIDVDVKKEVFDENNTAAAIYMLGVFIAVAMVVSKAF
jgi:hypothetical protein